MEALLLKQHILTPHAGIPENFGKSQIRDSFVNFRHSALPWWLFPVSFCCQAVLGSSSLGYVRSDSSFSSSPRLHISGYPNSLEFWGPLFSCIFFTLLSQSLLRTSHSFLPLSNCSSTYFEPVFSQVINDMTWNFTSHLLTHKSQIQ